MALAHADEDEVRSAYNSAVYLSPRRRMLQDWADHVIGMIPPETPQRQIENHATKAFGLEPITA